MREDVDKVSRERVFQAASIFIIALSLIIPRASKSQETDEGREISLEMLMAPPSPGFVLLSIEPAGVERPGSVTDLALTLLNRSQNLSQLPANFSMEVAPYWLAAGRNIHYEDYSNPRNLVSSILQSLSLSVATSSDSDGQADSLARSLALGIRFSVLSGKIDPDFDNYEVRLDSLYEKLGEINTEVAARNLSRKFTDAVLQALKQSLTTVSEETLMTESQKSQLIEKINEQMGQRNAQIESEVASEVREQFNRPIEEAKALASSLRFRRLGWKWDVAGGLSSGFPRGDFDSGQIDKWGIWATVGREWKKNSLLGVVRYLGHRADADSSSIDLGLRVIYDNTKKLACSLEAIYRIFPELEADNTEWRVALLLDYAIAKNKAISLTFGRDFGGQQSGNLISLVGLVFGFGSDRPI